MLKRILPLFCLAPLLFSGCISDNEYYPFEDHEEWLGENIIGPLIIRKGPQKTHHILFDSELLYGYSGSDTARKGHWQQNNSTTRHLLLKNGTATLYPFQNLGGYRSISYYSGFSTFCPAPLSSLTMHPVVQLTDLNSPRLFQWTGSGWQLNTQFNIAGDESNENYLRYLTDEAGTLYRCQIKLKRNAQHYLIQPERSYISIHSNREDYAILDTLDGAGYFHSAIFYQNTFYFLLDRFDSEPDYYLFTLYRVSSGKSSFNTIKLQRGYYSFSPFSLVQGKVRLYFHNGDTANVFQIEPDTVQLIEKIPLRTPKDTAYSQKYHGELNIDKHGCLHFIQLEQPSILFNTFDPDNSPDEIDTGTAPIPTATNPIINDLRITHRVLGPVDETSNYIDSTETINIHKSLADYFSTFDYYLDHEGNLSLAILFDFQISKERDNPENASPLASPLRHQAIYFMEKTEGQWQSRKVYELNKP